MPSTTAATPGSAAAATTPLTRFPRTSPAVDGPVPVTGAVFDISAFSTATASHTITAE
ncbi:hypothetical protein [Arthrobacter nitrophenolicus]